MKRLRLRLIGAVLLAAILCGALAGGAQAARTTLVLTEEGGPQFPPGATVGLYIEFPEAECVLEGYAAVGANAAKRDILNEPFSVTLCEDSEVPGGAIKEIQLTSTGKATVLADPAELLLLDPELEGCIYEFKKLKGTFKSPGPLQVTGEATGKLSKALTTVKGCLPKDRVEFVIGMEAESELLTS